MPYNITAIRDAGATDGTMYPVLGHEGSPYLVEIEPDDGTTIARFTATGLQVAELQGDTYRTTGRVSEVSIDVYITDARLIIACAKYNKSGGFRGFNVSGLVVAGVANAVSHANAARKRKGNLLVGHIRYPWLARVGPSTKQGIGQTNDLRFLLTEKTTDTLRSLRFDLTLGKNDNPPRLAQEIVQRAARYRLARDITETHPQHDDFLALTTAAPLAPPPKAFVFYTMPTSFKARPDTAHQPRQNAAT